MELHQIGHGSEEDNVIVYDYDRLL
jgi:hypothetical protein